jgi:hypothetical protein
MTKHRKAAAPAPRWVELERRLERLAVALVEDREPAFAADSRTGAAFVAAMRQSLEWLFHEELKRLYGTCPEEVAFVEKEFYVRVGKAMEGHHGRA